MSSRRKLRKEEGQTKLKGLIKDNTTNKSAKQQTPPSAEKPNPKRINKQNTMDVDQNTKVMEGTSDSSRSPGTPMNPMVFDLATMEQRLIASFQENIKTEVCNVIKLLQESINVLEPLKSEVEELQTKLSGVENTKGWLERRLNETEVNPIFYSTSFNVDESLD